MMEQERGANRVTEELDCAVQPWMPIGGRMMGGRSCYQADKRKAGSVKEVGVVLLATLALLFTGVIGGKAIMEALYCRDLQSQIEQRLFEVTR
jgi:hypothetical protein